uniref:Uncharacterized protein n=1 Tax=Bos indicus x Bos taurus TaxID=30522 RepID=A0A4W2DTT8_BOBOX
MEGEVLSEDELLMKLRDSRCRFQRRMQQLIEKYNQPFEDGPVIQMSTLTYQTPQGTNQLKSWILLGKYLGKFALGEVSVYRSALCVRAESLQPCPTL